MTNTLDRVDGLRDRLAELYCDGLSNKELAEKLFSEFVEIEEVPVKNTILNWRKDETVNNKIHAIMRERGGRLIRKVDASFDNIDWNELTVKERLEIKKAYQPEAERFNGDDKPDPAAMDEELFGAADEDPEFAEKLLNQED